eukprot:9857661-Heterocapsa_arctica.AAC.1
MDEVVMQIRATAAAWGRPGEDVEKAFSRRAPPERCGIWPTTPSNWMLTGGGTRRSSLFPGKSVLRIPSVEQIKVAHDASKASTQPTVRRKEYKLR